MTPKPDWALKMQERWANGAYSHFTPGPKALDELEQEIRFWSKVNFNGPLPESCPELGPCWLWTAGQFSDGYGGYRNKRVHRYARQIIFGDVVPELEVCHRCDEILCCKPWHTFNGTAKDNIADMWSKNRQGGQFTNGTDLRRHGPKKCSICKQHGHNKLTCITREHEDELEGVEG